MEITTPTQEISVALLLSDLKQAKVFSGIFRQAGVVPYIYTELKEFWHGVLEDRPHLCLVDVTMMTQDHYILKNHPMIQTSELEIAFVWSQATAPLLHSTFDILSLGNISLDTNLQGQMKSLLRRFNDRQILKNEAKKGQLADIDQGGKIEKLISLNQDFREKEFYQSLLKNIMGKFESFRDAEDFDFANAGVWGTVGEVLEFSILELSKNGQKLISPQMEYEKFRPIPSLWLGKTCEDGIEFFAQNMASQVSVELLGGELMSLLIRGKRENPDKMLFLRVRDEEFLNQFDWETLERYLCGIYSYFESKKLKSTSKLSGVMQPYELYSFLDQIEFGRIADSSVAPLTRDYNLISISFSKIIDEIKEEGRFFWESFYKDFFGQLEAVKHLDFRMCPFGVENVIMIIENSELDKTLKELNAFSKRFPIWKYFEDGDAVLAKEMVPLVKMIPTSKQAVEYSLGLEEYDPSAILSSASEKKQAFWKDAPLRSM